MNLVHFKRVLLTVFYVSISAVLAAIPDGPFHDVVLHKNIKTVQLYRQGWEFSYPILVLADDKLLLLSFDDLDGKSKVYNYSIVHCDANWMPSRLSPSEYLEGFAVNPINTYESSVSTNIPYTHYTLTIPNENLSLKISGNYIVLVYEDAKEDQPIFIKRFVVSEQIVEIVANAKRPILPKFQNSFQEVNFTILHPSYSIENPHETVKVVMIKNNQWNYSVNDIKPMFIKNDEIVYENDEKNLFPGGNEYRSFDIKDLKYKQSNIQSIDFVNNAYQIILKPDKTRNRNGYFFNEDLNGKYLIGNQQGNTPNTDAEYVNVHLSLLMNEAMDNGDVFVTGGFSDNNCSDDYRMIYNAERKEYEINILVKQGYYNYQYLFIPKKADNSVEIDLEGNFYETENDYALYIYHSPYGSRYDHLIGVKVINSLKKTSSF